MKTFDESIRTFANANKNDADGGWLSKYTVLGQEISGSLPMRDYLQDMVAHEVRKLAGSDPWAWAVNFALRFFISGVVVGIEMEKQEMGEPTE